jgi:hypothetical protein
MNTPSISSEECLTVPLNSPLLIAMPLITSPARIPIRDEVAANVELPLDECSEIIGYHTDIVTQFDGIRQRAGMASAPPRIAAADVSGDGTRAVAVA